MKRIDQICGLAVIDADSGAKIGEVIRVVLSAESKSIVGIDISPRNFTSGLRFIDFGDIEIFGDFSVLIKRSETSGAGKSAREGYPETPKSQTEPKKKKKPETVLELGQKVYLTDGSNIGWFTNALIDEASGSIQSLEISQGYIDDLAKGRCWINEFSCGDQGITALSSGRS